MSQSTRLAYIICVLSAILPATIACGGKFDDRTVPGKWIKPLLPEDVPEPDYAQYDKGNFLEMARTQVWSGQYRRALVTLGMVRRGKPVEVALLRGEAALALGRFDRATATLSEPKVASNPQVQTLLARVKAAEGKFDGAIELLQQVVSENPSLILPRYLLGEYRESVGDISGAKTAYQWFLDQPQNYLEQWSGHPTTFNSAEDLTYIGCAIDRWATLTMAYQDNHSLHDTILSMFVHAYDLIDRDYWPAHVQAARYFLQHDDSAGAIEELKVAVSCNPSDIESWKLIGKIHLEQFDFDGVDNAVQSIRDVDPDSIDANILQARNYMLQRVPKFAVPLLHQVLDRQPKNIEALGLLAGAQALLLHDDESAQTLKQVDSIDSNNALAYLEVAEQLASMRQYPRSADMYLVAVKRAPWWSAARNGLGLLYTQSGDEDASRKVLEAARSLDPFNVRTTNYFRLLDNMAKFARKESAHFVVLYDAVQDPMIPEYFSDYLESVYPQVCGDFHFEPKVKTLIEVFPTHDAFSVRTTGAPWIATVGASTGRVIALVAPRKGAQTMGTFNWSQVLHHEFTHTVTLGETDNRIAHWFTEGLAVQQEHVPLRWEWVPMLYSAVTKHQLFNMDEITWGFIRPKKPMDRQLAYAQSSWICEYIEKTYGHATILDMLEQFRLGKDQDEVFQISLHKSQSDFFNEFEGWCQQQVAGWGYDEESSAKYDQLREEGERLVKARDYPKAVIAYEKIVKLRPMDLLPHQRLAGLYMTKSVNAPEKAVEQLDKLAASELNNNMFAKGAARIYRDIGKIDEAAARALQAVFINPYDADAHNLLADLYKKQGDTKGLAHEERAIEELDNWHDPSAEQDASPATSPSN
ncbi:MAG: tetratricopeptide repeat protein [Planctomycetota bacterium]|nr:tetratricopeptide repeat protein [Planctomycetota bacterium]